MSLLKFFWMPTLVSAICFAVVGVYAGLAALVITILLVILEVTLSFDNAVVNAKVLQRMTPIWQKRFLTWGILFAVFLTRAILPILIVAASVWVNPIAIAKLAIFDPAQYGMLLHDAHYVIGSFGAVFLMLVGLKYFIDDQKETHWIAAIEKHLARSGSIESIETAAVLLLLLGAAAFVPTHAVEIMVAGIIGAVTFIIVQGLASAFEVEGEEVAKAGFVLFAYLNVLDAAFSLDSVVGAFALSTNLLIIVIGLGIGAYFVRSMTVYMVRQKTLNTFIYLEHGAHYAILGLAFAMFFGLMFHVPEPVTGLIGLTFILAALASSWRLRPGK